MRYLRHFGALAALATPTAAAAEINVGESLEWMVADSDLVVRGQVLSVTASRGPGQVVYERARVRIDETIKGVARPVVDILVRHVGPAERPSSWRADRSELLLFLVDSSRRAGEDTAYRRAPFAVRAGVHGLSAIRLGAASPEAFTMDQRVLSSRAAILDAARAAGKFAGRTRPTPFNLDADGPIFQRLWAGSAVWLQVPIDARLEVLARSAIGSSRLRDRLQAVRALGHFKSAANIALMKRLLADPGSHVEIEGKRQTRVFAVRAAALANLRAWGAGNNLAPTVRVPIADAP
jgi:hypothetical protein